MTISPADPNISYIGRFNWANPQAPTFDWPGVVIEAAFSGPAITLHLEDGNNLYNLYLDGVPEIARYNEVDTRVMMEIVAYLRRSHGA